MRNNIFLTALFLIALSTRLHSACLPQPVPADDALEYDHLAVNISAGRGYAGDDGKPTSFRPPFYPLVLSGIYLAFGHSYLAVRIFQALLGTVTVFLFYSIGRRMHSKETGLLAAFFAAIYPPYIALTGLLFTETLFTFLLALSVRLFLALRDSLSKGHAVLLAAALAALSLTRPSAVFLPFVFMMILAVSAPKDRLKPLLYAAAAVFLVYAAAILPWAWRNTVVHGRPVLISSNGGLNFYQSVSPIEGKIFGMVPDDANTLAAAGIGNEAERDAFLFKKGAEKLLRDPAGSARMALLRYLFYWGFFDWEVQRGDEYNYIYGFILPFFILGFIPALKNPGRSAALTGVIAYFTLIVVFSQGTVRYRLPIDGYIFIISSCAMLRLFARAKYKAAASAAVAGYFLVNYAAFLNSAALKAFFKKAAENIGIW